MATILCHI